MFVDFAFSWGPIPPMETWNASKLHRMPGSGTVDGEFCFVGTGMSYHSPSGDIPVIGALLLLLLSLLVGDNLPHFLQVYQIINCNIRYRFNIRLTLPPNDLGPYTLLIFTTLL